MKILIMVYHLESKIHPQQFDRIYNIILVLSSMSQERMKKHFFFKEQSELYLVIIITIITRSRSSSKTIRTETSVSFGSTLSETARRTSFATTRTHIVATKPPLQIQKKNESVSCDPIDQRARPRNQNGFFLRSQVIQICNGGKLK